MKSVLLCGATGLVGRECLELLAADPSVSRIVAVTRRPLTAGIPRTRSRVEEHVINFDHLRDYADLLRVSHIICALGTTIRKAGSTERFRQVDFGYSFALARMGAEQSAEHFLLVSAVGANPRSRFFYSRVKGELEEAISALPYRSITIVRPSLLLGERSEFRLREELGRRLSFLAPSRYRPVAAVAVAAALIQAGRESRPGRRVIESAQIRSMADTYFRNVAATTTDE